MDVSTTSVIRKIKNDYDDLTEYDELVEAWTLLCERAWKESSTENQFADVEKAAINALSDTGPDNSEQADIIGSAVSRLLDSFDYPTYLVNSDCIVTATNASAWRTYDLDVGDTIRTLPLILQEARSLAQVISETLSQKDECTDSQIILERAHQTDDQQEVTIAISRSSGREPAALVFVITPKWKPKSTEILKRQYGLTKAESQVLLYFIDGYSTQDIATNRNRSHETIRAQFQSIRQKVGAKNQTDLLRMTLSVSDFSTQIGTITDAIEHPYRRKAVILRKGARRIELTMMGDFEGTFILTVASPSVYTCNSNIEKQLHDKKLCVISVCTPGCGETDPPPHGQDRISCIAEDVDTVLDQLQIERCFLLAITNNSPICFALTRLLPDRFLHLIHITASVPPRFSWQNSSQSPWVTGIMRASYKHPAMKKVLINGAMKAWKTLGARQFMRMQLHSNPVDTEQAFRADNLVENQKALRTATIGGIFAASEDIALAFDDWSDDIESAPIEITAIHGVEDQLFPIEGTRNFAARFAEKVDLIEVPDAGFTMIQSHTELIMDYLETIVESYSVRH